MADLMTPLWNDMGLIPPIDEAEPTSSVRSPYEMDIIRFVTMFAITPVRKRILLGFLEFRQTLYLSGICDGFQWLNGSFSENIELIEHRPPNDIDVVTFFNLPDGVTEDIVFNRNPQIFDHEYVKSTHFVDSYFQSLQMPGAQLVSSTVYWYSMWAHKRDWSWKGFLQVPLSPGLDGAAFTILNNAIVDGGEQ